MADSKKNLYDGLFLMNQAVSSDLGSAMNHIQEILDRAEATTVALYKWDDRRLAYPIRGQKRGLYIQAVFEADPVKLNFIERDCNLSDEVIRAMVLKADHMGETEIEHAKQQSQVSADERAIRGEGEGEGEGEGQAEAQGETAAEPAEAAAE